jgi:hypothetical protein
MRRNETRYIASVRDFRPMAMAIISEDERAPRYSFESTAIMMSEFL